MFLFGDFFLIKLKVKAYGYKINTERQCWQSPASLTCVINTTQRSDLQ